MIIEAYANVYPDRCSSFYATRRLSDLRAASDRVACVYLVGEYDQTMTSSTKPVIMEELILLRRENTVLKRDKIRLERERDGIKKQMEDLVSEMERVSRERKHLQTEVLMMEARAKVFGHGYKKDPMDEDFFF